MGSTARATTFVLAGPRGVQPTAPEPGTGARTRTTSPVTRIHVQRCTVTSSCDRLTVGARRRWAVVARAPHGPVGADRVRRYGDSLRRPIRGRTHRGSPSRNPSPRVFARPFFACQCGSVECRWDVRRAGRTGGLCGAFRRRLGTGRATDRRRSLRPPPAIAFLPVASVAHPTAPSHRIATRRSILRHLAWKNRTHGHVEATACMCTQGESARVARWLALPTCAISG